MHGALGSQDPASGDLAVIKNPPPAKGPAMARAKFLVDTNHPDYGKITKGEVVSVTRQYMTEYEALGFAVETDEDFTSRPVYFVDPLPQEGQD